MLGSLHSEPILDELATDGPARVAATLRALACAVLDAPVSSAAPGWPAVGAAP